MRSLLLRVVLSIFALGLGSCGLIGGGGDEPAAETEPVAAVPQTTPTEEAPTEEGEDGDGTAEEGESEEETTEAAEPPAPPPPQSDLKPSTSPEDRVAGLTTGKKDPFNNPLVTVTRSGSPAEPLTGGNPLVTLPPVEVKEPEPPPKPPEPPEPPKPPEPPENEAAENSTPPIPQIAPLSIPELPQAEPPPNLGVTPGLLPVPAVPAGPVGPPPPNTARAIEVSAVVQVGQTVKAIVKSPGEPSRYVGVGDYVGGGSVYVKDINVFTPDEPIVTLQENGQDVSRQVGADALPPIEPPKPAGGPVETTVRDVRLGDIKLTDIAGGFLISGTLQNLGEEALEVKQLTLQLQEKGTGTIITDINIFVDANLQPDQKREFRVPQTGPNVKAVVLGGRPASQLVAILLDWE